MALQTYTGAWARNNVRTLPYIGAQKWGTGVNPVHAIREGQPREDDQTQPEVPGYTADVSGFIESQYPYGYNPEDIAGLDVFSDQAFATIGMPYHQDDRPDLDEPTPTTTIAPIPHETSHPWGIGQMAKNMLRGFRGGPWNGVHRGMTIAGIPTETVSEGWVNKAKDGMVADSLSADDSQVFIQTSMVQRYKTQNNQRAVERNTDVPRSEIDSRVEPQKVKHYSGDERHYDMFPYQIDQIPRPFRYRTAGVGPEHYLDPQEMIVFETLQRTPPPDPSMGVVDTDLSDGSRQYGYEGEDVGYY